MHLKRLLSWFSFHDVNNLDVRMNETWPELYRLNTKLYSKMDSIIFPTLKFSTPHDDVRKGWPLTSETWLTGGTILGKCPEKVCCFEGPNEHSSLHRPDEEDQPGFFLELSNQIELLPANARCHVWRKASKASSEPLNDHVGPCMSWGGRAFTQL